MRSLPLDEAGMERLRAELEGIDGVRRALLDGPRTVYLVCDAGEPSRIEMLAGTALGRYGVDRGDVDVQVAFVAAPQPSRRVRFLHARVARPGAGRAVATVAVEWAGTVYEGEAEGESGSSVELRLAALAALRSLDAVVGEPLGFRLVGVRTLRAFDTDLVAVLLHTDRGAGPLIGATLSRESVHESTALAVLNATNRVLGNYLVTGD